ncbi:hypothetical protein BDW_06335 [Bdellovibrio bacteriovorus W]|nr:hypothetical protein BDW_06335 [Bdellovibrio bacteriovorus W]
MIKRIKSISNMGIYKDFKWSNSRGISDFCERNIIYGWNYSGKTTLSRIFSSLEKGILDASFSEADFKLVLTDGTEITTKNLESLPSRVRVFNADYIRENLKWDAGTSFSPISFDVGENVALRSEYEQNEKKILRIKGDKNQKGRIERYQGDQNLLSDFEKILSKEAKTIKNETFQSLIEFDLRHLKAIIPKVQNALADHIIRDEVELSTARKTALSSNNKTNVSPIKISTNLIKYSTEVVEILKSEPRQSDLLEVLENNEQLYKWSKNGLTLHENLSECSFCGSKLTDLRIEHLKSYFSNESAILRDRIQKCRTDIETETNKLKTFLMPPNKHELTESCQDDFEQYITQLRTICEEFEATAKILKDDLNRKEDGNIFISISPSAIDLTVDSRLLECMTKINAVIERHNNIVANFTSEQQHSRERLKNHCVAELLERENYIEKSIKKHRADKLVKRYLSIAQKLEFKNQQILSKLKSVVAGQDALNSFIRSFLNRDDIYIEVTPEDKFHLKRGENLASNLSEGEKTAISFAYFLVTLESLFKEGKLRETVVFIDDPISSLDGNHIAQVYALINSFFFRRIDPADTKKVVSCFKQLFISTHNFEFFSFLQDSSPMKKKKDEFAKCEYYFIQRLSKDHSSIVPLPSRLRKTKSEYVFLYELLHEFHERGCSLDDDFFLLIPNAIRRFLEIYSLAKLPGTNTEIDQRLDILMGGVHQLKVLHHFSHFNTLEKITKHDELIMLVPNAVKELMQLLQKDPLHHSSLIEAIGKKADTTA